MDTSVYKSMQEPTPLASVQWQPATREKWCVTDKWDTAMQRVAGKVAPQNFELWLRPIECRAIRGDLITLRAPNQYVRLWFESNYLPAVLDELRQETDNDYRVEFEAEPAPAPAPAPEPEPIASASGSSIDALPAAAGSLAVHAAPAPTPPPRERQHDDELMGSLAANLNPRYKFDTFVAGPSNQLAFAASRAAAAATRPSTTRCSSAAAPGWARPTCCTPSAPRSSRRAPARASLHLAPSAS